MTDIAVEWMDDEAQKVTEEDVSLWRYNFDCSWLGYGVRIKCQIVVDMKDGFTKDALMFN